jgi:hypothetical protein
LHTKRIFNEPALWIKTPNAFKAIVDPDLFQRAQQILNRRKLLSDEDVLAKLKRSVKKYGVMTHEEMRKRRDVLGPRVFVWRFGTLANAYALIGETGRAPHVRLGRQKSRRLGQPILAAVLRRLQEDGRSVTVHKFGCRILVDNRWDCRLHIIRRRVDRAKAARWPVRLREQTGGDFYLLARESADGESKLDYYVLPGGIARTFPTVLKIRNGAEIDRFRVRDLSAAITNLVTFLSDT